MVVDESQAEAEARLWMDTQSHASSSSSDTQEGDCWLGYPTSFCTQFKVSIDNQLPHHIRCRIYGLKRIYRRVDLVTTSS